MTLQRWDYLCGFCFSGKKGPQAHPALRNRQPPLGISELVGVHTIRMLPLWGRSLHWEGSSVYRAPPSLCSDLILSLEDWLPALCTPHSSQGRPGTSGPSAPTGSLPPKLPSLHCSSSLSARWKRISRHRAFQKGVSLLKTKSRERVGPASAAG